jgi:hypothetical protein
MRILLLLCLIANLWSCASLEEKKYLVLVDSPGWRLDSSGRYSRYIYQCEQGDIVEVQLSNVIAADGKAFFVFFVVPIHNYSDRHFSDLRLLYTSSSEQIECSTRSVSATFEGTKHNPVEAKRFDSNGNTCSVSWKVPELEHGDLSIDLGTFSSCETKPLRFVYKSKIDYDYGPICC